MIEFEIEEIKPTLNLHGYEYIEFLAKGSFSIVLLCQSLKYNQQFAVKRTSKNRLSKFEYDSLISLDHPNIIKLYDAFEDDKAQYLVMEYCPNGTIRRHIPILYDKFIYYAKQILGALAFCHKNNIAHRDIKADNIFLDQYNQIKLADFGLSRQFNDTKKSNEKCGSLMYLAPEILHYYEVCPFKADIWALGITFYIMTTGKYPFQGKSRAEIKQSILFSELDFSKQKIDPKIQFLISKMTIKSAKSRPTAEKILQLPMFLSEFPRRTSLIFDQSGKKFYTTGLSNQSNPTLMRTSLNIKRHYLSDDEDDKKQSPALDVLSYRSINVNPNIQRMTARSQSTKPT